MEKVPRCLLIFENSCKSKKTFKDYKDFLDNFLEWSHKDYESLLLLGQKELEIILQDYCIYQRKRAQSKEISPNSIPSFFNGIFKFLKVNRKEFDEEAIIQLYPSKEKLAGEKAITTEQVQILLDSTGEKREKALIHVFSATGARPEAICDLQFKHIEQYQDGFLKLILYPNDEHEMITFLHPEASEVFLAHIEERKTKGEKIIGESYAFRANSYKASNIIPKPMSLSVLENIMFRLWKKSGIQRTKKGKRYDLASITGFRKRFDTILEMNPDISMGATQYLMDHTGYMSGRHYRRPNKEQIFEAYCKAVSQLAISDEMRLEQEIKQKEEQLLKNETQKDKRISGLERRLQNSEKLLQTVLEKLNSIS